MLNPRALFLPSYRGLQRFVVKPLISKSLLKRQTNEKFSEILPKNSNQTRIWYHAASAGELESLWPLIESSAQSGQEIIVTVFSPSALRGLKKLQDSLRTQSAKLIFSGFSPWEGEWKEVFQKVRPDAFITYKYEAWPDLWISAAEEEIPIVIVGARPRTSLNVARRVCELFLGKLPRLLFLPFQQTDQLGLQNSFPNSSLEIVGDPRWERVLARSKLGSPRAKELLDRFALMPRPWGVMGSVWQQDLEFWKNSISEVKGALWVVPHCTDSESIEKIESFLLELGLKPVRSSNSPFTEKTQCILVDEMGILAELYSQADWAYVGGGFHAGVHSTIEPAIYGVPISIGPKRAHQFAEIEEMCQSGQVTLLQEEKDLTEWARRLNSHEFSSQKSVWMEQAFQRVQNSQKIGAAIENFI